ncbi:MAG: trehalose-phosphatase [Elusimicrobiota bacterium]
MPRSLFDAWPAFERQLRAQRGLLIAFDFDGTLAAPVPHPNRSRLGGRTRRLLERLQRLNRGSTAIISGRGLADLRRRAAAEGLIYAGNHGIEMAGPGIRFLHPKARAAARALRPIAAALKRRLREHPRVHIEDKRFSLSLHFQGAPAGDQDAVRRAVESATAGRRRSFEVLLGRGVSEVRPRISWEKGDALRRLRGRSRRFPVFVGDDTVDEHAFAAARSAGGAGIRIGRPRHSAATHYLDRQSQVNDLLARLARLLEGAG